MTNKEIITNDIKAPNKDMEVLRKHFSHCFNKNGEFQIEKFKQSISESEISFSKESYSMDWLGKSYARLLASDPATTLLKEDKEHNQKLGNKEAKNLLLKGDNLEVLKHLTNAYYEKIKMIYIDPPYNTGKDAFVYQDDRKFTVDELKDLAGIDKERAQRILDFTQSKSNSHSAWLTFMYPRLYITKQLLKEDGVIFISIDDNEIAQLKLMMDEVFGEQNFIGQIVLQTATDNNLTQINIEHEYILCYCRNLSMQEKWFIQSVNAKKIQNKYLELKSIFLNDVERIQIELRKWIRSNKNDLERVTHYDNVDAFGVFHDGDIANTKFGGYEYDVIHPITKEICKVPPKGFRFPESTLKQMIENGSIMFGKDENTLIKPKIRVTEVKDVLRSVIYEDGRAATKNLEQLFDRKSVFQNPKSEVIIERLIEFTTSKDNLVLDFFAGSGTTGDAVMRLNAEDGGNRKYILVQLPEGIDKKDKAAYEFVTKELKAEPTIFEITKERLIRSAKKINQELDEKNKKLETEVKILKAELPTEETKEKIDLLKEEIKVNKQVQAQNNFKVFETIPIWEDYHFEAKELDEQLSLFDETKLTEEDLQALLITWKTYDGIALTESLEEIDLAGYKAYFANDKLYLIDKDFTTESLKTLLERIDSDKSFNPTSIIVFGYHFESKNLRELAENLKSYSNKKNIDIDFITRY